MKHLILILAMATTLSCTAQLTVYNLDGPIGAHHYRKDLNNVRDNFAGTWQYSQNGKEFTLHIYKIDKAFAGNYWGQGKYYEDKIIGNYIYKENGVELINTTSKLTDLDNITATPFYGTTQDGITTFKSITYLTDYGTILVNDDCENYAKSGQVGMAITNLNSGQPLQATFRLDHPVHFTALITSSCGTWSWDFSIPREMTLIKISDVPPPLQ